MARIPLGIIILISVTSAVVASNKTSITALIKWLLSEDNYTKNFPPGIDRQGNDTQTEVFLELLPSDIHSVSDVKMEFQMEGYVHLSWLDERLDYTANLSSLAQSSLVNTSGLQLDVSSIEGVWRPNIYFTREREAEVQDVPRRNELLFIYPNGTVVYSVRLWLRHGCPMFLQKYPFDSQTCTIDIRSYSISTTYQKLRCLQEKTDVNDIEVAEFVIDNQLTCGEYQSAGKIDVFSGIKLTMTIHRKIGNFIMYVFLPSIFIVMLSWISFWIHPEIVHGRLSLGIVCVLTMVAKTASILDELPPLSYVRAIDVWMIVCQFCVVSALMEYAYVYHTYVNIPTIKTVSICILDELPPLSYVRAIDVWMIVCQFCVVSALMEYAYVYHTCVNIPTSKTVDRSSGLEQSTRVSPGQTNSDRNQSDVRGNTGTGDEQDVDLRREFHTSLQLDKKESERINVAMPQPVTVSLNPVDKWSRAVFPIVFVLFVIGYFVTCSYLPD